MRVLAGGVSFTGGRIEGSSSSTYFLNLCPFRSGKDCAGEGFISSAVTHDSCFGILINPICMYTRYTCAYTCTVNTALKIM
jgi:hypothetical protein